VIVIAGSFNIVPLGQCKGSIGSVRSRIAMPAQTAVFGLEPRWCTIVHRREMAFEWDPRRAAANLRKHGVRFADAIPVREDERAVTVVDEYPYGSRSGWIL
jgi:hypothetical protein